MAKSNEIKDLEALLSESNIDAEIESILEELGGDEAAEKTGEVEETSPLKDSTTDGSVLDQDPSTKDAIDSGLDEPGVAADNEVVIPDEDKKVDVVITVEKDKEPTIDAEVDETVDAGVDETVDKLSAELNQSELGESFTNIYNILSDNINDIDEKSFEADYDGYKDDGKECVSVDQAEGKECDTECLKDTDIKTDIEASKLNEQDEEQNNGGGQVEPNKRKTKAKKAVKNVDNVANVAASGAAAGYGIKKTVDMFNDKKAAQSDIDEINKLKNYKDDLAYAQQRIDDLKKNGLEVFDSEKKEVEDIKKRIESNKFADKTDMEVRQALSDAKDSEQLANTLGTLGAIGSAALLAKTGASVVRAIKDFKGKKEKEEMSESVDFEDTTIKTDLTESKEEKKEKFKKVKEVASKTDAVVSPLTGAGVAVGSSLFAKHFADKVEAGKDEKAKNEKLASDTKTARETKEKASKDLEQGKTDKIVAEKELADAKAEVDAAQEKYDSTVNKEDIGKAAAELEKAKNNYTNKENAVKDKSATIENLEKTKIVADSEADKYKDVNLDSLDAKNAELAKNISDNTLGVVGGAVTAGLSAIGAIKGAAKAVKKFKKDKKEELEESAQLINSDTLDVLKDLIDVHGDDNTLIIAKKGELDKPGAALIKIKISKEQFRKLEPEFHEEEKLPVVTESQVALMIANENNDRLFAELVEATALANRLQNAIFEKYADLAKDRAASLNEELSVWNDTFEEETDSPAQPLIEERYVTLEDLCAILDESGYEVNEESLANLIVDIINEDVVFELNEASSAEKRAYKDGGEDMDDLVTGKAIARIKDEKSRDAAVAAKKAGRDDVVKSFTGDRKEQQAEKSIEKKFEKMQKAGADDVTKPEKLSKSGKPLDYYIKKQELIYPSEYYKSDEYKAMLKRERESEVTSASIPHGLVKEPIKEEAKNVRMAKTASEVNNFYTTDFSEKKDSCDKECEDKENCDCFTVTKDVDNHTDVELSDASANTPEKGNVDAEESDWFDKDETTDVKEVIVESEEFNSVAKEFLEENDYEVDDENVYLIKEAFINGRLSELDENLTESFLAGKMYAKKAAALTAKINKKRETEKDASEELAKLDKVINKARANGVSIDYADVDGRVSLSMI